MPWTGSFATALQRLATDQPARRVIYAPEEREPVVTADLLWTRTLNARAQLASARLGEGDAVLWRGGNTSGFYSVLPAALEARIVLLLADQTTPLEVIQDLESRWGVVGRIEGTSSSSVRSGVALPGDLRFVHTPAHVPRHWPGAGVIKLTSGSAGAPRGVFVTEANLWDDVTRIVEAMDIRAADVQLASIPITHSYGLGNLVLPTLGFGTAVVLRAARRPAAFAADASSFGVTSYPATPHLFDYLLECLPHGVSRSLRLLVSAGAPLSARTAASARHRWGVKIHSFYGTTETGGIAFDDSDDDQPEGCVGRCLPRTSVDWRPAAHSTPGAGRIFVRSGSVACGYVSADGPIEADEFCDGGFLTSDLGVPGDGGRLHLVGRVTGLINVGGLKVDPAEVESVIRSAPGVTGALVVGVPCRSHGEDVVAVVTAADGVHSQHLEAFCRTRLTRHGVPRRFVMLDQLPVNSRGKIDGIALRRRVADQACDRR